MINKVVIADDSSTARMIIRRCLEIAGCMEASFIEAADGRQALDMVYADDVDLLVSDINMPNVDGKMLLHEVKANPKLADLPIIIVSSAGNAAVRDELISLGALAVVDKPISPASMADAMQTLAGESQWG